MRRLLAFVCALEINVKKRRRTREHEERERKEKKRERKGKEEKKKKKKKGKKIGRKESLITSCGVKALQLFSKFLSQYSTGINAGFDQL